MEYLAGYIAALLLFVVLDLVWIKFVMRPIFTRSLGDLMLEDPRMTPAIVFFILYQMGILYLAVMPAVEADSWALAGLHGALIGLIAYGTYESTNLATLKRWTSKMAAIDVSWGVVSSTLTALFGFLTVSSLT
ncbi:MAG: DUF2177 family protein [Pseudomonadota bacterium]